MNRLYSVALRCLRIFAGTVAAIVAIFGLSGIAASLYVSLSISDLLYPLKVRICTPVAEVVLANLPVGRASWSQGGEGFWFPSDMAVSETYNGMPRTPYRLTMPDRSERSFLTRVVSDFGCNASWYQVQFFFGHFILSCGIVLFYGQWRVRKIRLGLPENSRAVQINAGGVLLRVVLLGGVLSVVWPGVAQLVWGVWKEYAKLVNKWYPAYEVVDKYGHTGMQRDYYDGAALGWFGYYGVFAGVFLSYVLTVWWSAKFVIGRAVRRQVVALQAEISATDTIAPAGGEENDNSNGTATFVSVSRCRQWAWRVALGLLLLMLYGWPLVVGWAGRILPDSIVIYVPY